MPRTRVCSVLGIDHPVVLGGMSSGTSPELVAAVSGAGGLGILGCSSRPPQDIAGLADAIRRLTDRPFGLNQLLFMADSAAITAILDAKPAIFSTAWPSASMDLAPLFARAHDSGAKVVHMVSDVRGATQAAEAGADVIVAQGTEGGGHTGVMGTMVLVPMVARAVAPVPVLAAGGVADGAGLAAALMLGAEGVLLGTRFLATNEAPIADGWKRVIVQSNGHDTILTEIPDVASGTVWPGAYVRMIRNRAVERWIGREGELRYRSAEVAAKARKSRDEGDADEAFLLLGETAGLIDSVEPAARVVERIVTDADRLLRERAGALREV